MPDSAIKLASDPQVLALSPVRTALQCFAQGLVIHDDALYQRAAKQLKQIKGALAQIEDARTRITKPLNDSLRETNAQAKAAAAPFLADEQLIKGAMIRYSDEQDKIRAEAQRRANEAAERERRRLQAIADKATCKAQEEAAAKRRAAEEAAAQGLTAEAQKLNAQATRLEDRAAEKAQAFEGRANQVIAPIAEQAAPKVAGVSGSMVWDFELIDSALIPREYLDVSEIRIRRVVAALQGNTRIPGVRVFQRKRIAASAS